MKQNELSRTLFTLTWWKRLFELDCLNLGRRAFIFELNTIYLNHVISRKKQERSTTISSFEYYSYTDTFIRAWCNSSPNGKCENSIVENVQQSYILWSRETYVHKMLDRFFCIKKNIVHEKVSIRVQNQTEMFFPGIGRKNVLSLKFFLWSLKSFRIWEIWVHKKWNCGLSTLLRILESLFT